MGGITFLIMLAGFGYVVYWYLSNLLHGKDGSSGILGIKRSAHEPAQQSKKTSKLAYFRDNPEAQKELKEASQYDHNSKQD